MHQRNTSCGTGRAWIWVPLVALAASSSAEDLLTDVRRETRTDSVQDKLALIQHAYDAGRFDLALSLSESLKDTLVCEERLRSDPGEPPIDADDFGRVNDLPAAWADWAHGWAYVAPLTFAEPIGVARLQEPVEVRLAFHADRSTDLYRELRVARIDAAAGSLQKIPSQVDAAVRRGKKRFCRLTFFADIAAYGKTSYLVFCGNPLAELPTYSSDLRIAGEGYDLEITNNHYVASLSSQTGQLERLRYKRQHGLELYAGGKGHGEPPTIDWSNDYVDQDHYQKHRIRNWSQPPNYEVDRGALAVRIRRWGFPHSPVHPVFTPSRLHIDQTYTFYAGKDYFLKEGTMEAVKDFELSAMRDDEWVLSGYSFSDKLWIDDQGKIHEGDVPEEAAQDLRGVGFYHENSRDAFVALWLEHTIDGLERLERNGVPTLHYHQHGQLWSRYPVGSGKLQFKRGTVIRQRNAYLVAPFTEQRKAADIEDLWKRLRHPVRIDPRELPRISAVAAVETLARAGETPETATLKPAIWRALRDIRDEQLYRVDSNVVDMGYIYDLKVHGGVVEILMTMPHRGRPVFEYFVTQGGGRNTEGIRERLLQIDGVDKVIVNFTWEPTWTSDRLTAAGRRAVGLED